jgi:hypothetical protein
MIVAVARTANDASFDPSRLKVTVPGTPFTVPVKVSTSWKRRRRKRDLREWRQPLVNEPLKPAQLRSFIAGRIGLGQELAQQ